jgi:hypothetical protein
MSKREKFELKLNDCESHQRRSGTSEFVVEHMNVEALKILYEYCAEFSTSLLISKRIVDLVRGLKIR